MTLMMVVFACSQAVCLHMPNVVVFDLHLQCRSSFRPGTMTSLLGIVDVCVESEV